MASWIACASTGNPAPYLRSMMPSARWSASKMQTSPVPQRLGASRNGSSWLLNQHRPPPDDVACAVECALQRQLHAAVLLEQLGHRSAGQKALGEQCMRARAFIGEDRRPFRGRIARRCDRSRAGDPSRSRRWCEHSMGVVTALPRPRSRPHWWPPPRSTGRWERPQRRPRPCNARVSHAPARPGVRRLR